MRRDRAESARISRMASMRKKRVVRMRAAA
jgi:hypothetical protein